LDLIRASERLGWRLLYCWDGQNVKCFWPSGVAPYYGKIIGKDQKMAISVSQVSPAASFALPLTVAEYFAGIGLVRMGLQSEGWRVTYANDISSKKYEMYRGFFPDNPSHYVIRDIFELDAGSIPAATLATCSFPCIDLSLAGNMSGIMDGSHSSAFWGFVKVLKAQARAAPPIVLVENVPGWLHSNGGKDFRVTVQALNELGYACDVFVLDALRFMPQSRLRVFLVGSIHPVSDNRSDLILSRPHSLMPKVLRKNIEANPDLHWFFNAIPEPPPLRADGLAGVVEKLPDDDSRWWSAFEVERHLQMMADIHKQRVEQLAAGRQTAYRTFFRRRREGVLRAEVRNDELAGCLRTAAGGSGKQFLIRAGRDKVRMRAMTAREYARLQGVPDHYAIAADGVQALTGFGDAVCVPAISWIARRVLTPLAARFNSVYAS